VIHIPDNISKKINFLVGDSDQIFDTPEIVYDEVRVNFLSDLSTALLKHQDIRKHADAATFAFWCRRSNLNKIITNLNSNYLRLGLGMVYHNSPSNVPVNFAFSMAFGILSGNTGVVRLSSKESESTSFIVNALSKLLETRE